MVKRPANHTKPRPRRKTRHVWVHEPSPDRSPGPPSGHPGALRGDLGLRGLHRHRGVRSPPGVPLGERPPDDLRALRTRRLALLNRGDSTRPSTWGQERRSMLRIAGRRAIAGAGLERPPLIDPVQQGSYNHDKCEDAQHTVSTQSESEEHWCRDEPDAYREYPQRSVGHRSPFPSLSAIRISMNQRPMRTQYRSRVRPPG